MNTQENIQLNSLTTFGTGGSARYFVVIENEGELEEAFAFAAEKSLEVFILGGGSNIVLADNDFDGLVLKISLKGINIIDSNQGDVVLVKVAAGEVWDDVVDFAVDNGLWGIENLSAIPGSAGAFAVQNVGAYGQEASQVVDSVRVFDRNDNKIKTLTADECQFQYRSSIFNSSQKNRYIILETALLLSKNPQPKIEYPDVITYFEKQNISNPKLLDIRKAIVEIRNSKFPNLESVGAAGSFFKNLYLTEDEYHRMYDKIKLNNPEVLTELENLKNKFQNGNSIKIPTAFLIDQVCGLKGTQIGGAMISNTQALAILNPEKEATSEDVMALIDLVKKCVHDNTGQSLSVEPDLVGF